jgi:acetyl-CoA acyltransferase
VFAQDEHPRATTIDALAKLKGVVRAGWQRHRRQRLRRQRRRLRAADRQRRSGAAAWPDAAARIVGMATAGVAPRVMGIGPAPAVQKLLRQTGLTLEQMDLIELNEAFASQGLAVLRELGLRDDDARVNPDGGAIALGHPLGMSGARLVTTAAYQLQRTGGRYALCTMCIGVGQGIAMIIERV